MSPATWQEWIAWAGLILPLSALAWSAIFYTMARRREIAFQEFERLFKVADHLGQQGGSIASKMVAAYELRRYPDYKDVLVRLCRETKIEGAAAEMLKNEMLLTAQYLER